MRRRHLGHLAEEVAEAEAFLLERKLEARSASLLAELQADFGSLQDLIPVFRYWPVAGVQPTACQRCARAPSKPFTPTALR